MLVGLLSLARTVITLFLAFDWEMLGWQFAYRVASNWYAVVVLVCFTTFILWVHGAHRNLFAFGTTSRFSDAASVYWWLVPFANMVVPYKVVEEIVDSMEARVNSQERTKKRARIWWMLLVGGVVLHFVSVSLPLPGGGGFAFALLVEAVSAAALAVAALLAVRLVRRVTELQIGYF